VLLDDHPGLRLPVLTTLGCEELTARSLLPLTLVRPAPGAARPSFTTRSAVWVGGLDSSDDLIGLLEEVDSRERWFDDAVPALQSGAAQPAFAADDPPPCLPASTRRVHDHVPASRRSLHFLTPHLDTALAAELNTHYRSIRAKAAQELLTGEWQGLVRVW
jgi:hypothetical protein